MGNATLPGTHLLEALLRICVNADTSTKIVMILHNVTQIQDAACRATASVSGVNLGNIYPTIQNVAGATNAWVEMLRLLQGTDQAPVSVYPDTRGITTMLVPCVH